jgi:hypothetical protein
VTCSINKGKENGNNKLCHPQKSSPLSFDMFLSLKYSIINIFWLTNIQITCFWPKCLNESKNFQKNGWSAFSYIIFIFHLNFHTRISPITLLWNIFIIFHTLWWVLFWSQYIITYKIFIFTEYFWKIKYIKFQNFQSSQYFHQIQCTHLVKFLKCRKLYFVRTILGDFDVFLPNPPQFIIKML